MGHRLTRIYTRTGDDGTTGLADGSRVRKDSPRIELFGEIDELNARIGLLISAVGEDPLLTCLKEIQQLLFDLGGDLSIPGRQSIRQEHSTWLESWMDTFNAEMPPLREFVLPGGNQAAAFAHLARTGCRNAERRAVHLSLSESIAPESIQFLNRLSDFLFVTCRILGRAGGNEHLWEPERNPLLWPPH
jgi:cob(I)alamin adenosyltransferase